MKKLLLALCVVLPLASAVVFAYRERIGMVLAFSRLKPEHGYADVPPPPPRDYSDPSAWAALPENDDAADVVPSADVQDLQASAAVDVFFVHPTTYYDKATWNQPLDDASANQLTDVFVLRSQAAVFNSCCRIYAPRYRQATLYSFLDRAGSGAAALELAYQDVERAFEYFLDHYNQGRPFILAGHSQGAEHIRKLLERRITGTRLRERLVAAYPIGFSIDGVALAAAAPDVPVCTTPAQTGCVVSWNSIGPDAERFDDPRNNICVNPLTWHADGAYADRRLNIGAVAYPGTFEGRLADLKSLPREFVEAKPVLEPAVADAQCVDGMLVIRQIHSHLYQARPMGRDNYHIYDYSLFHMSLRRNAQMRAARFLSQRPPSSPLELSVEAAPGRRANF